MGPNEAKFFQDNPDFNQNLYFYNKISYINRELIKKEKYSLTLSKFDLATILSKMNNDQDSIIIETEYDYNNSNNELECTLHLVDEEKYKLYKNEQEVLDIKQKAQDKLLKLLRKAKEEDAKIISEDIRRKQYLALKAEFEGSK